MNLTRTLIWTILFVLLAFAASIMFMFGAIGGGHMDEYFRTMAGSSNSALYLAQLAIIPFRVAYEASKMITMIGLVFAYFWGFDMINPGWVTEIKEKIHKRTE